MSTPNYSIISPQFVFIENEKLIFDFKSVNFLSVFDITELFFYCCSNFNNISSYEIRNSNEATGYLERVNFFYALGTVKNFNSNLIYKSDYTGNNDRILELQTYMLSANFNKNAGKILEMFKIISLSDNTAQSLLASIYEVSNNAFSHNLGMWRNNIGPLAACLIQNYKYKNERELCISFCDFGVGFLATLKNKYPDLNNEEEAINCALKENITSRPSPQKGGNGLVFLQKNIFNGFKGNLFIRSANTLVQVSKRETIEVIRNDLPFNFGANVFFTIKY